MIFAVSRIRTRGYFMVTKLHNLIIYKKSTVENASLSFWVFSFFQYFKQKVYFKQIDILSDIVAPYKEPENLSKKL